MIAPRKDASGNRGLSMLPVIWFLTFFQERGADTSPRPTEGPRSPRKEHRTGAAPEWARSRQFVPSLEVSRFSVGANLASTQNHVVILLSIDHSRTSLHMARRVSKSNSEKFLKSAKRKQGSSPLFRVECEGRNVGRKGRQTGAANERRAQSE